MQPPSTERGTISFPQVPDPNNPAQNLPGTFYNISNYDPKGTGHPDDSAEITWDANTHLSVKLDYGKLLRTTQGPHPANGITDSLTTRYLVQAKGRLVKNTDNVDITTYPQPRPDASTPAPNAPVYQSEGSVVAPTFNGGRHPSQTFKYDNGPSNGLKLDVLAQRQGVDDHYGQYVADITLTWADLN